MRTAVAIALAMLLAACATTSCDPLDKACKAAEDAARQSATMYFLQSYTQQQNNNALMYQQQSMQHFQQSTVPRQTTCQYEPVTRMMRCN